MEKSDWNSTGSDVNILKSHKWTVHFVFTFNHTV